MDLAERVAFVQTQTVCAIAEIEGMKAANEWARQDKRYTQPYTEADFRAVPDRYQLGWNDVLTYLSDGR